jgi:hypothetical protein
MRSGDARVQDEPPPAARAPAGEVVGPQAKQCDGRRRVDERIRDNVSIAQGLRRDGLAVDERNQHLSFRDRSIVQRGEIADDMRVIDTGDPQRYRGTVRCVRRLRLAHLSDRAATLREPVKVCHVLPGGQHA